MPRPPEVPRNRVRLAYSAVRTFSSDRKALRRFGCATRVIGQDEALLVEGEGGLQRRLPREGA